ncbi:MAG: hypothetical protein Q8L53_12475 [Aestuariivirga sp.]|nr:hypothetical protein [Aestuariivirga sp.]
MKLKSKVAMSIAASSVIVGTQYFADNEVSGCNIKGNISATTGERIYHLPSQDYYDETVINFAKGERWFCSESEARQAGWRRSKV